MDVRPSPIAGVFYASNARALTAELDRYLSHAQADPPPGPVRGLIAPHAGLRYSGPVAAAGYRCVRGLHPETVVVVSPSHAPYPAPLLTSGHEAYRTPLGAVPVDGQAVAALHDELSARMGVGLTPVRNDREHAVEIQLPFLQRVLEDFRLLPVMMCDQGVAMARTLGEALAAAVADRPLLLVASSDLSHFYAAERAHELDAALLHRVEAYDPRGVIEAEAEGIGFACGRGAIAAVMWAAQRLGADCARVVAYGTSGDVTGDRSSVVGYGAAVLWQAPDSAAGSSLEEKP